MTNEAYEFFKLRSSQAVLLVAIHNPPINPLTVPMATELLRFPRTRP